MTPFKQADVERAIRAVTKRGLDVSSVEVAPDGTIRVLTKTAGEPQVVDELEAWRARRDKNKAARSEPRQQAAR